jgi:hypothetical protein
MNISIQNIEPSHTVEGKPYIITVQIDYKQLKRLFLTDNELILIAMMLGESGGNCLCGHYDDCIHATLKYRTDAAFRYIRKLRDDQV